MRRYVTALIIVLVLLGIVYYALQTVPGPRSTIREKTVTRANPVIVAAGISPAVLFIRLKMNVDRLILQILWEK